LKKLRLITNLKAIGRVIRHRLDYGAIILCDERFTQQSSISQLPGWMRLHLKKINDPALAITELGKFFNVAIKYFPLIMPKIPNLQSNSVSYINMDSSGNQNQNKSNLTSISFELTLTLTIKDLRLKTHIFR